MKVKYCPYCGKSIEKFDVVQDIKEEIHNTLPILGNNESFFDNVKDYIRCYNCAWYSNKNTKCIHPDVVWHLANGNGWSVTNCSHFIDKYDIKIEKGGSVPSDQNCKDCEYFKYGTLGDKFGYCKINKELIDYEESNNGYRKVNEAAITCNDFKNGYFPWRIREKKTKVRCEECKHYNYELNGYCNINNNNPLDSWWRYCSDFELKKVRCGNCKYLDDNHYPLLCKHSGNNINSEKKLIVCNAYEEKNNIALDNKCINCGGDIVYRNRYDGTSGAPWSIDCDGEVIGSNINTNKELKRLLLCECCYNDIWKLFPLIVNKKQYEIDMRSCRNCLYYRTFICGEFVMVDDSVIPDIYKATMCKNFKDKNKY